MKAIPLRISPAFFITAALIGFFSSRSLLGTLIWIGIIFVSVLVHEYGHAISSKLFGQNPRIELVAFGGVTIPSGPPLPLWKEFIVVFCGPLFGFLLFVLATLVVLSGVITNPLMLTILNIFRIVNLFWSFLNLIPVMPLDGGQLMRILFEGGFGIKGRRYALIVSMILSILFAFALFFYGFIIIGALFFLFAFQNFEVIRQTKGIANSDSNEHLKEEIVIAEHQFLSGKIEDAKRHFENILSEVKEGIIHRSASEYLAQIYAQENKKEQAYDLLMQIKTNDLSDISKCLLHKLSFEMENYSKVMELSGICFQENPTLEIAKRSAIAAAKLENKKATLGWLKTCIQYGLENIREFAHQSEFDYLKNNPELQKIIEKNTKK